MDLMKCRCYVLNRPLSEAMALHWGAHEETCQVYSVSGDPLDRLKDEEHRERYTDIPVSYQAREAWRIIEARLGRRTAPRRVAG